MKYSKFNEIEQIQLIIFFWGQRFGAAGVGARPQNFGRVCRRPQNGPSGALPATILGTPVEMLLLQTLAFRL
jgi:hypothetical protein